MFVVLFIAILGLILFYNYYWKRKDLPPGPPPLPIIGNLIDVALNPPGYDTYKKWQKLYGDVYTYWISEQPVVVVADYNLINETFIKDGDSYAGRTTMGEYHTYVRGGKQGIILAEGEIWREHRRFALKVFRNFGMGRGVMEEKILCELDNMLKGLFKQFHHSKQQPTTIELNLIPIFEITVSNIINQILFGFAYHDEEEKKEFAKYKDRIARHMRMMTFPSILLGLMFNKTVRYFPYFKGQMDMLLGDFNFVSDYCKEQIQKHKVEMKSSNYDRASEPKNYVEAYLREAEKNESETFNDTQLVLSLLDLWVAGQETTANTLIFSVLYLIHNPKIQEKIHQELDSVIATDRRITVADRNSLIYLNAFINEVQRSVNLLPQNLLHKTTKDVKVGNYFIKKGTTITPQISTVLFDEKIFPEPNKFKPDRFIDSNGDLKKIDELVPFSVGKRQCLGESLARMELFLIVANFYNLFKVSPIDCNNLPSLDKTPGITIQPKPFTCLITKRF